MAHNFETGFSVREVPWHGLGEILADYPGSWAEARTLAGLDWEPEERPVYEVDEMFADGRCTVKLIEDFKQVVRSDNGFRLAIATEGYQIIRHEVFGEIFEEILNKSDGQVKYETAGSLEQGKKVWALARFGGEFELPGDPSPMQAYLALMSAHDGTAALKVVATDVRIVCSNTWHLADMDSTKRGSAYSFRHTKGWRSRVDDAKAALTNVQRDIEQTREQARAMLEVKVNERQAKEFIRQFAIHRTIENTVGRRPSTKISLEERLKQPQVERSLNHTLDELHMIMESRTTEGIRGTMYGLVQAAGEFSDHMRGTASQESYFSRTMLIDREPLKLAAIRLAGQVVETVA